MGQAMEIGSSKIFRSKGLVFAQFWSKSENSSSDWWTTDQILKEKYSRHIFAKKGVSLDKNLKGVSDHLEILHVKRFCGGLKKTWSAVSKGTQAVTNVVNQAFCESTLTAEDKKGKKTLHYALSP